MTLFCYYTDIALTCWVSSLDMPPNHQQGWLKKKKNADSLSELLNPNLLIRGGSALSTRLPCDSDLSIII